MEHIFQLNQPHILLFFSLKLANILDIITQIIYKKHEGILRIPFNLSEEKKLFLKKRTNP